MSQSLASVLVHIVFSTKYREPMIRPEIEEELYRYIAAICRAHGSPAHKIGGIADHIHIACSLGRSVTISELVERIKTSSSRWMKGKGYHAFRWQNGYGIFSFRESGLVTVCRYIERQKEHHRARTFQEEYRRLLDRHRLQWDERYLWE